jgi:glycyl-tRNA synthetase beta chain
MSEAHTADLLLELGSEELPAAFVNQGVADLSTQLREALGRARLDMGDTRYQLFATPRRLAVLVHGVQVRQAEKSERVTGPSEAVARDAQGKWTAAALGFARKQGVEPGQLVIEGGRLQATVVEAGKPALELLPEICQGAIAALRFPKAMRWGDGDLTFARPLVWILALLGSERIPFRHGEIESGTETRGHRFLDPKPFRVAEPSSYALLLQDSSVVPEFPERRQVVAGQLVQAALELGAQLVADEALIDEVTNLVEWPTAVLGGFDPGFLTLPREVLLSEMKSHQRYFALERAFADGTSELLPRFVAISGTPVRAPAVARHGYERVLRARLADARFFYDEDRKRTLASRVPDLAAVVFQKQLGSVAEKVARVERLAAFLAGKVTPPGADLSATATRAAHLSKADLTSGMVGEFPELQGVMGRYYALHDGEPEAVARAIEEHYLPRFAGDRLPESRAGAAVAVADRLDTIAGMFGIGKAPTATADPLGLRRGCLAVVRIVIERGLRLSLRRAVEVSLEPLREKLAQPTELVAAQVLEFFRGRLKALWSESQPPDVVEAVLSAGFDDLALARLRLLALAKYKDGPDFLELAIGFKRAVNILAKVQDDLAPDVDITRLIEEPEKALHRAQVEAAAAITRPVATGDYETVMRELLRLKPHIDRFFDRVMVMDKDDRLRENRVRLLSRVRDLFFTVADLSKIQVEGGA